jgi:hypothetical protein
MLKAKNIIYGFCNYTNPPKHKYLISLYRSDELNIIAVFPTSQRRSGVEMPRHGRILRDGKVVSYVFDAGHPIGKRVGKDEDFAFQLQTTIPFDYCFSEGNQDELLNRFESPEVVGVLSDQEYIDLIYAFYIEIVDKKHDRAIFWLLVSVYNLFLFHFLK